MKTWKENNLIQKFKENIEIPEEELIKVNYVKEVFPEFKKGDCPIVPNIHDKFFREESEDLNAFKDSQGNLYGWASDDKFHIIAFDDTYNLTFDQYNIYKDEDEENLNDRELEIYNKIEDYRDLKDELRYYKVPWAESWINPLVIAWKVIDIPINCVNFVEKTKDINWIYLFKDIKSKENT